MQEEKEVPPGGATLRGLGRQPPPPPPKGPLANN